VFQQTEPQEAGVSRVLKKSESAAGGRNFAEPACPGVEHSPDGLTQSRMAGKVSLNGSEISLRLKARSFTTIAII
jgi:hypothetical protein